MTYDVIAALVGALGLGTYLSWLARSVIRLSADLRDVRSHQLRDTSHDDARLIL